jgi:Rad3-related DNA helicase
MREKYIDAVIMIGMALLLLVAVIIQVQHRDRPVEYITKRDTIREQIEARIDTIHKERIKLKTIYEKQVDTIYLYDSIAIDSAYTKAIQKLIEMEGAGFFK